MSDLASLSAQLVSLNYLTRPLDLAPVFAPSLPSSSSSSGAQQQQLASDARVREQFLRCVWAMLAARNQASEALESVDGLLRTREYELERMEAMVETERRKAKRAEEDAKQEQAKAK